MSQPDQAPALLFVCLGNICRSPMAEGAMRAAAAAAGLRVAIDSAGIGKWHVGEPPARRAQAQMKRRGIDIGTLRARQIEPRDFSRFDWIFGADRENLAALHQNCPAGSDARLHLLMDWVPGRAGTDVADPFFGDAEGFATTWRDVSAAAGAIVERLR